MQSTSEEDCCSDVPVLLELGLCEQDMFPDARVILHEGHFLNEHSWILLLYIEVARSSTAQELYEDSSCLGLRHGADSFQVSGFQLLADVMGPNSHPADNTSPGPAAGVANSYTELHEQATFGKCDRQRL